MAGTPTLFEGRSIRKVWFKDEWWFAVVDVIAVLTESSDPQAYWRKLKQRLRSEGSTIVTDCHALRLPASDGRFRAIDCANTELLLRIIQSVPSPNAEPFKLWLAQVGSDRIDEAGDPEAAYVEWRKRAILAYPLRVKTPSIRRADRPVRPTQSPLITRKGYKWRTLESRTAMTRAPHAHLSPCPLRLALDRRAARRVA